jgi:hypothetical protein
LKEQSRRAFPSALPSETNWQMNEAFQKIPVSLKLTPITKDFLIFFPAST